MKRQEANAGSGATLKVSANCSVTLQTLPGAATVAVRQGALAQNYAGRCFVFGAEKVVIERF